MPAPIYEVKAQFFKTLGHPARIRVLEILREGERSVAELRPLVGIEASHLSHQLAILRRAGVVRSRREGSSVVYAVTDRRVFDLLQVAKEILSGTLSGASALAAELEALRFVDGQS